MIEEFETPRSRVEAILQNMLGAENVLPPPQSRIEYYLQKLLEEFGNLTTFKVFNPDWVTDSTTAAFCASVNSDPEAVAGMAFLGELTCSDLPFNGNADAVVEVIDGTGTSGKVIHIVITSGTTYPYRWEYTYWNDGSNVSGWIAYATTSTVQANPTLAGTEADLTGLQINETKYAIPQGTIVVANPSPAGSTSLTGIEIDGAKYIVPTELPAVTSVDAGKFARVSSQGIWIADTVPSAENQSF